MRGPVRSSPRTASSKVSISANEVHHLFELLIAEAEAGRRRQRPLVPGPQAREEPLREHLPSRPVDGRQVGLRHLLRRHQARDDLTAVGHLHHVPLLHGADVLRELGPDLPDACRLDARCPLLRHTAIVATVALLPSTLLQLLPTYATT